MNAPSTPDAEARLRLYQQRDEGLVTLGLTLASLSLDTVTDVCDTINALVVSELAGVAGAILLCDPDPDLPGDYRRDSLRLQASRDMPLAAHVPTEGVWGRLVHDLETVSGPVGGDAVPPVGGLTEGHLVGVPIISRGSAIGVLIVVVPAGADGLDEDGLVRTLRIISSVTAMAVINVRNREAELELRANLEAERARALEEADERRRALGQVEQQLAIIRDQEAAIRSLSSPIITVWEGVLALPVIGQVNAERAASMSEGLLRAVTESNAQIAIIDLTGVELVDTHTMDSLMRLARSVSLLGSECVLAGLSARVARGLVSLGLDLGNLRTFADLRSALAWSLESSGFRVERPQAKNV